ncbi:MAG: hypothetical protein PHQ64_01230 [Bacilli bacterium]|nr:hypothetical protein [Bacilli bacterium]
MVGKIIVIEGTECSGKDTQSKLLVEKLASRGIKAIHLGFPMYDSATGKIIKGPYLGKDEEINSYFKEGPINVDPKIACLYYAADRLYNIDKIKEYVKEGYYVILDRYISSNMAHQGCKIEDKDERFNMFQWIDKLEYWLLNLPKPDITILLKLPYEYNNILKSKRKCVQGDEEHQEYYKNVEITYNELSGLYNWDTVECVKDNTIREIEDINTEILNIIIEKKETIHY